MKALAVLLAITSAAAVSAQPSAEELAKRLGKSMDPWKGCAPGSWVQMRTVTKTGTQANANPPMEYRQTLVARDETGCKVETRMVKRIKDEQGGEKIELGEPNVTTMSSQTGTTYKDVKELEKDTVLVGDRKLECRVIEATAVSSYAQPGGQKVESTSKVKMWVSDEVKEMGGVVKTESDTDGNGGPMGGSWSGDMKLVETDKEVKVGSTTLKCSVYKFGSWSGKEENAASGEFWTSADAPMGYAKVISHVKMTGNGMNMEMDSETELTDMAITTEKSE